MASKSSEAAKALQDKGFRILHIGQTITVAGERRLFEQIFKTKLIKQSKRVLPGLSNSAKIDFFAPEKPPVIPIELRSLIKDVVFPEPPEYMP